MVLGTWKLLTGGIHLDGVADGLDGLAGRDRAERLAIMRDSRVGVFGALGLILFLLLGFASLAGVPGPLRGRALLLAPAVGRFAPLLLARACVAATPGRGFGGSFMGAVTRPAVGIGGIVVIAVASAVLWPWGLLAAVTGLVVAWVAARFFSRRLGGLTGDGLGAAVELGEVGVLLAFVSFHHLSLV
jgi:adenosylcobinamide-GDP ribazoletransferase